MSNAPPMTKWTVANPIYCRLGRESRDMGLFKDDDGKGYLLTEDVCTPSLLCSE